MFISITFQIRSNSKKLELLALGGRARTLHKSKSAILQATWHQLIPIFSSCFFQISRTTGYQYLGVCEPFVGDILKNFPLNFPFHTQHAIPTIASHHLPNKPPKPCQLYLVNWCWILIHQFFCWFSCVFSCFFPSIKYLWIFAIDVKHRERSQVQDLGSGLCQQLCQHLSHLYLCLSEHPWQLGSCDQRPLDGLKINAAGWNILSIEPLSPKLSGRLATSQHTVSTYHTREDKNNVVCSLFRICHFWTWHKSCTQDPQYCPAHAALSFCLVTEKNRTIGRSDMQVAQKGLEKITKCFHSLTNHGRI